MSPFPPRIEQLPYNWSTDRGAYPILLIVAHGTAGSDSRAYLSRGGDRPDGSDRKVSIHRLIRKDGTIYRYVENERGANHAGAATATITIGGRTYRAGEVNKISLSFELENLQDGKDPYPDAQLLAMGWQIAEWRRLYGNLPLFRHAVIDPTRRHDPVGLTLDQIESWVMRAMHLWPAPRPTDIWALWGNAYPLPVEQRPWGIPQLWAENARWLKEARSNPMYAIMDAHDGHNRFVVQAFQGGAIYGLDDQYHLIRFPRELP